MIRRIADGVWTYDIPYRRAGFHLGARTTLLRIGDALAMISPVPFEDAAAAELRSLGEIRWIIAPSLWHYMFVPKARGLFPAARVFGAPGLREKRPKLGIEAVLTVDREPAFDGLLDLHVIQGMPALGEVAFLHPPSRTLVVTDLVANIRDSTHWPTRTYLRLAGADGRVAQTFLLKALVRDKAALRRSLDVLLGWDWDRLIMAHGEIVEKGGKEELAAGLAWVG